MNHGCEVEVETLKAYHEQFTTVSDLADETLIDLLAIRAFCNSQGQAFYFSNLRVVL